MKIASNFSEITHEGPGSESATFSIAERADTDCTWLLEVWAKLSDKSGLTQSFFAFVGSFEFGPPPGSSPSTRVLCTASLPGAQRWLAKLTLVRGTLATSDFNVSPGRCECSSLPPGIVRVFQAPPPVTP